MIRVTNFFDAVPEDLQREQKRLEKDLLEHKKASKSCWSRKEVKPILIAFFNGKCAYCEAKLVNPESIDHYRPKAKEKYYWLAHEWTNFLPACLSCQKAKDNTFETQNENQLTPPLDSEGNLDYMRCAVNSVYLLSEEPYLLHPVLDNPEEHFDLDLKKARGKIVPLSKRGEKTEETCKLNRPNLIIARKEIIEEYQKKFKENYRKLKEQGVDEQNSLVLAQKNVLNLILEKLNDKENDYLFVYRKLVALFG